MDFLAVDVPERGGVFSLLRGISPGEDIDYLLTPSVVKSSSTYLSIAVDANLSRDK